MQNNPYAIKDRLLRALDNDNNVVDMPAVTEIIGLLERQTITKEDLEKTRLGKYINALRKKTADVALAKRAKNLIRKWNIMVLGDGGGGGSINGEYTASMGGGTAVRVPPIPTVAHLPGPGPGGGSLRSTPVSPRTVLNSPGHSRNHSGSSPMVSPKLDPKLNHRSSAVERLSPLSTVADRQRQQGFKPVSPALPLRTSGNGFKSQPHSPALPSSRCSTTSPKLTSPFSPASTGRRRPDVDEDSCDSSSRQSPRQRNDATLHKLPQPPAIVNGSSEWYDVSVDSIHSQGDAPDSTPLPNSCDSWARDSIPTLEPPNAAPVPVANKPGRKRKVKVDPLKNKLALATQNKVPKLQTTLELYESLKSRKRQAEQEAALSQADEIKNRSFPRASSDEAEDVSRNKSELMEKFLNDSHLRTSASRPSTSAGYCDNSNESRTESADPIAAIMATLPPIDPNQIQWSSEESASSSDSSSSSSSSDEEESTQVPRRRKKRRKRKAITELDIDRLHDQIWDGVNGSFDRSGTFQAWSHILIQEPLPGQPILPILPYCDLDDLL